MDEKYVIARNKLIPLATRKANMTCGKEKPIGYDFQIGKVQGDWANDWNRCFLEEMDRLAKEIGLVK